MISGFEQALTCDPLSEYQEREGRVQWFEEF